MLALEQQREVESSRSSANDVDVHYVSNEQMEEAVPEALYFGRLQVQGFAELLVDSAGANKSGTFPGFKQDRAVSSSPSISGFFLRL